MKNYKSINVLAIIGVLILTSCAPIYKCGDPIPEKKPMGKRLGIVINERDSLCTDLAQKKQTSSGLRSDKAVLEKKLSTQQTINYDQADQFGKALQEKSLALQEQERLLKEQESLLLDIEKANRVSRLRTLHNPNLPTGHLHITEFESPEVQFNESFKNVIGVKIALKNMLLYTKISRS